MEMKTELGKSIMREKKAEKSHLRRIIEERKKELAKQKAKQDMIDSYKLWTQLHPKMDRLTASMKTLLKDTEELVISLNEPLYLVELEDSKEIIICKTSDLKRVKGGSHA
jgi:hypothetical protein